MTMTVTGGDANVSGESWIDYYLITVPHYELQMVRVEKILDPTKAGALLDPPADLAAWVSTLPGVQVVTSEKGTKVGGLDARQIDIVASNDLSFGPIPGVDDPPGSGIAAGTAARVVALVVHGRHVLIWLAADETGSTHFADAAAKLQPVLDAIAWQ